MGFKTGVLVGVGVGYVLGAKAGRARFEQIERAFRQLRSSDAMETATGKARAALDLGVERARDFVDSSSMHPSRVAGSRVTHGDPSLN